MADAYKCDFCGLLTEGKADSLRTEIYGSDSTSKYQPKFLGILTVGFKRERHDDGKIAAEVCPPCIRKFAQRMVEHK